MTPVRLVACVLGTGAGFFAALFAVGVAGRVGDGGFWQRLAAVGRLLLSADEETPFLREYLRLWPALFVFLARQLAIVLAAAMPIALAFGCTTLVAAGIGDLAPADFELQFGAAVFVAALVGLLVAKWKS